MKSVQIPKISESEGMPITEISHFLDKNFSYQYVDMLNWPIEFSYKPSCKFKIAFSDIKLYIKFYVTESNVKAQYLNDKDPVWKDSCVEFFCQIPGGKTYCNFEVNCVGACLATKRTGRDENIIPFSAEQLARIERYASLERKLLNISSTCKWSITLGIPFDLIDDLFINEAPKKLLANFYKCGDETKTPHYLSWSLISTESPDFHRPDFFGELFF